MAKKLYVGNLPYDVTDQELEELFSQAGKVISANVVMDRYTGRSKGFGFVEMATEEDAQKAIKELNQHQLKERTIVVNEARPREERGDRERSRPRPRQR